MNAIPYIGGSLDVLFAYKGEQIVQDRITKILEDLKAQKNRAREEAVDKKHLESEERIFHLFFYVCKEVGSYVRYQADTGVTKEAYTLSQRLSGN